MLSPKSITAIIHERIDEGWIGTLVTDPAAVFAMPEIGIELPLAALYGGLKFEPN